MKLLRTILTVFALSLISTSAWSQTFMYDGIEGQLTEEQRSDIERAQAQVEKAEKSIKKAEAVEAKYASLMKSKKKKKRKKWEKKGWEAKKYRIDAELKYAKGFELTGNVYSELISNGDFYSNSDKTDAEALNADALNLTEEANSKLKKLKKSAGSKSALQKAKYKKITGDINDIHELYEDALAKQFEAIEIYLKQADKKLYDQKDNLAWEEAQDINTIDSYTDYLSNFSQGKYVGQARDKIAAIKKAQKEEAERKKIQETIPTDYTFKVQIAAARVPLSNSSIKRKYSGSEKVERVKVGSYYKYRVGNFNTYQEAAALKNTIKTRGAFIVVFDKDNNQIEVTEEMKH